MLIKYILGDITFHDELKLELVCPSLPHIPISACYTQEFLEFLLREKQYEIWRWTTSQFVWSNLGQIPWHATVATIWCGLTFMGPGPLESYNRGWLPLSVKSPLHDWLANNRRVRFLCSFGTMSPVSEDQIEQLAVGFPLGCPKGRPWRCLLRPCGQLSTIEGARRGGAKEMAGGQRLGTADRNTIPQSDRGVH